MEQIRASGAPSLLCRQLRQSSSNRRHRRHHHHQGQQRSKSGDEPTGVARRHDRRKYPTADAPHAGRYQPGGSPFSSSGCWACIRVERFFVRGWDRSFADPAGPRRWPKGKLSQRAGSMSPSQSATSRRGWGFHIVQGGIDSADRRFRPRTVGFVDVWKDFRSSNTTLSSRGTSTLA